MIYCIISEALASARLMFLCEILCLGFIIGDLWQDFMAAVKVVLTFVNNRLTYLLTFMQ